MFTLARINDNKYILLSYVAVVEGDRQYIAEFMRSLGCPENDLEKALSFVDGVEEHYTCQKHDTATKPEVA